MIWNLSYIDFPICLDRVEFAYLNMEWQEAPFTEVFDNPKGRMSFVISNKQLPCNDEFIFVAKAYGVNGEYPRCGRYYLKGEVQESTPTPPGIPPAV